MAPAARARVQSDHFQLGHTARRQPTLCRVTVSDAQSQRPHSGEQLTTLSLGQPCAAAASDAGSRTIGGMLCLLTRVIF